MDINIFNRNKGALNLKNRNKVKKTWLILFIAVPLAIYLFYFTLGYRGSRQAPQGEPPPERYLTAGSPAKTSIGTVRAGVSDYEVHFYDHLKIGGNTIVADPGLIFASIPVLITERSEINPISGATWVLLDEAGNAYSRLPVDPDRLSNIYKVGGQEVPAGAAVNYLLFKVRAGAAAYYLKLITDEGPVYWLLHGNPQGVLQ